LSSFFEKLTGEGDLIKEKICKTIRNSIILGELSPGEHLIESELCRKHKISRGSIREVFHMLANEGFVTITPNKGAIVTRLSTKDLKDFYTLVALLERHAVEWSAPHMTRSDIAELTRINDSFNNATISDVQEKIKKWGEVNSAFHRFFWDRSENNKIGWLIQEIRKRIYRYRYNSLASTSYDESLKEHAMIIKAINTKNVEKAGQLMEDHIIRAMKSILNLIPYR
jgi:DNA-binding GntR family transcriptional regulator